MRIPYGTDADKQTGREKGTITLLKSVIDTAHTPSKRMENAAIHGNKMPTKYFLARRDRPRKK